MAIKALLFGSLDTLVDTHEVQRAAFNEAFRTAGLDWHWEPGTYKRLIARASNESRLMEYAAETGHTLDDETRDTIQRERTMRYAGLLDDMSPTPRPGVDRLVNVAMGEGRRVALVANEETEMVSAFRAKFGAALGMDDFAFTLDRSAGHAPKPASDPYDEALRRLEITPDEAVAIEDTEFGVASANAAGIASLAVPGEWTNEQDFTPALAVVDQLGTMQHPARSLRVPVPMEDNVVTLDWLQGVMLMDQAAAA